MEPIIKKSLVEYISGRRKTLTLVGDPVFISVMYEAANASRKLLLALQEGKIDEVSSALERKRIAVSRYERVTGQNWGL
jgi:hypothetical protein